MCGIAGLIDTGMSPAALREAVQQMTDSIAYRGPDEEGFFIGDGVGFGARRLSIIDVAGGAQPIGNEDLSIQVILNGEIYNYRDLRAELRNAGHILRTSCDTEVIAHLYEDRGLECMSALLGMFSFALWDQKNKRLLLARDRMGKKPLFYALHRDRLLFGSEIKAILAAAPELAEPNWAATITYFQNGFISEPNTMYRNIRKVPAAHYLIYERGQITVRPYWHLNWDSQPNSACRFADAVEELDALLEECVRIRLVSEVPLGIFLSGGIDSSAIVAYAHKAGLRPLKTFTIGFDRPRCDESADARIVADHFHTEHHCLHLHEAELMASLPGTILSLVRHFDEPFGDSSALPTYHVARLARQHVTVILSGDGGDELFWGYSHYRGIKFAELYGRLPSILNRRAIPFLFRSAAALLPHGRRYGTLRALKVLEDSLLPFQAMYRSKLTVYRGKMLRQLFTKDFRSKYEGSRPKSALDDPNIFGADAPAMVKAGYIDLRHTLLEDMLVKVDRMSMAHSLEVRSPLLDHRLVEFAVGLPPSFKLRGWESKAILRDTVARYLPSSAVRKSKQGFIVPLREWFRGPLNEMVRDYLGTTGSLPRGVFDHSAIRGMLSEHYSGAADHSSSMWSLLNFAAWHELNSKPTFRNHRRQSAVA